MKCKVFISFHTKRRRIYVVCFYLCSLCTGVTLYDLNWWIEVGKRFDQEPLKYSVSPNKHGNSVTIFPLSTSAQLGCKVNVWRGCVPVSQVEADKFDIVTEFPCLLGLNVYSWAQEFAKSTLNRPDLFRNPLTSFRTYKHYIVISLFLLFIISIYSQLE